MKHEFGGVIFDQLIRWKSKIYSIKKIDGSKSSTAKEVNIATEFSEFKDLLFNIKIIRHKMKRIQAKKHKIGTYEIHKISLSCFDNKRFVLDDGVHTLAYFHKDCNKKVNNNDNNNNNHDNDNEEWEWLWRMRIRMAMSIITSDIVIEVMRTVFIFLWRNF